MRTRRLTDESLELVFVIAPVMACNRHVVAVGRRIVMRVAVGVDLTRHIEC